MADQPLRIAIGRMSVRGVDPGVARALGPALQRALADAAAHGRLSARDLKLRLPAGASAVEIADALTRALGEDR